MWITCFLHIAPGVGTVAFSRSRCCSAVPDRTPNSAGCAPAELTYLDRWRSASTASNAERTQETVESGRGRGQTKDPFSAAQLSWQHHGVPTNVDPGDPSAVLKSRIGGTELFVLKTFHLVWGKLWKSGLIVFSWAILNEIAPFSNNYTWLILPSIIPWGLKEDPRFRNNHGNLIHSHLAACIAPEATQTYPIIRACKKKPAMRPSFSSGSVSVSYGVLDLHGTAVSNDGSNDDHKLLFLSWINVRFFWEMKHRRVLIDGPFPPTHSIWPEHMITRGSGSSGLRRPDCDWHVNACEMIRANISEDFGAFRWTHLALSTVTFAVQTWWKWVCLFCQKSGIKMAFYSEEWLWNFVESVVSYMNDSC